MPLSRIDCSTRLPSRVTDARVVAALLVALGTQLLAPAFARPFADESDPPTPIAAETAAPATTGPAAVTPALEDRYWADHVRACSANAKHVRLHLPGRIVETDEVVTEAAGLRFRSPHLGTARETIIEGYGGTDTLVAWNDVSQVDVRNVNSAGEAAGTGLAVGLGVGAFVALLAAGAAAGSIYASQHQDSHATGIALGGAALGLALGAAVPHHPNGGWVTCCVRDSFMTDPGTASIH